MKSVLLIGASSSLGRSVSKTFYEAGDKIMGTYCGSPNSILKSDNVNSIFLDLSCDKSISNFGSRIQSQGYTFDLCIFLAGFLPGENIQNYENKKIDQVMAINFSGFSKVYRYLVSVFNQNSQVIIVSSLLNKTVGLSTLR